jgi:hypothetical protein
LRWRRIRKGLKRGVVSLNSFAWLASPAAALSLVLNATAVAAQELAREMAVANEGNQQRT